MSEKILVFSIGSLGDTLMILPTLRALKQHFDSAPMTLLCDVQAGSNYVLASDVLDGTGLIQGVITYIVHKGKGGQILNLLSKAMLLIRLRIQGFHTLVYLVEAYQDDRRIKRDILFFKLAGIKIFIGMNGLEQRPVSQGLFIARVVNRADELLGRVAVAGIPVPEPSQASFNVSHTASEVAALKQWWISLPPDGNRPWIGIGPGSKMPSKIWPKDRFQRVVQCLIDEFDVWPVIFGGREDAEIGEEMAGAWGRGYVAAGALNVRVAAVGLRQCKIYLGNDTGTMHLAAAVGTPCVAIFSSREPPGRWEPYGPNHLILRTTIDCAGCRLTDCVEKAKKCLMDITVEEVTDACRVIISQTVRERQAR